MGFINRSRRARSVAGLAAVAALLPFGAVASPATAAPKRTADTTKYTSALYLQHALGLPAKADHVIESITYDRFQWQLRQDGRYAYLIGDPATDATFAARAQDVEAAAEAAGVKDVYWFNPNLSGSAKLRESTSPALDIRNASAITQLAASKRAVFGHAWGNLVGRYLGNGIKVTQGGAANTGSASLTTAPDATVVNDHGATAGFSTKVGDTSGGALYGYGAAGEAPAHVLHSVFFVYDKNRTVDDGGPQPSKIAAWTDLTAQAGSAPARAAVTTALGGGAVASLSEFAWWKSATNTWQTTSSPNDYQGANHPVITDAHGDPANGGWKIHQVTYPELVFLLETEKAKDTVVLLGGTWCPNTRPVLPAINENAQQHDVTVFNWDTILDGSVVGGGNSGNNPLQTRGAVDSTGGSATADAVPSFVYGDLVSQYLSNLKTQYKPDAANKITFYPGGDKAKGLTSQPRLQVPYLFGYRGSAAPGGINRQWIHDQGNGDYTEYMSSWHWTNPKAGELGIQPANALRNTPAWTKLNEQLATFTWQTDVSTVLADTGTDADAAQYLTDSDVARVNVSGGVVTVTAGAGSGAIDVNPTALQAALTALGASAPANYTAARAAYLEASGASPAADPALLANLKTVVGAWGVSQARKITINGIWGNPGAPGSVAGGLAAVRAAEVFFEGLPDVPAPVPPVADPGPGTGGQPNPGPNPGPKAAVKLKVAKITGALKQKGRSLRLKLAAPAGGTPITATVKLTFTKKGAKKGKTVNAKVRKGVATVKLPKLARGTYKVKLTWAGNATYAPISANLKAMEIKK